MPNPVPPGKRWVIVSQHHTVGIDAAGNAGPGWNVAFTSAAGDTGEQFFADAQYSAANVKARLDAVVTEMEAVRGLNG